MYKIKIGVIGAGYISQVCHLPFLAKNNHCEIKAIIEKNENLLNKVADKYKIKNRYKNYQEIIEKKVKLDAVFICVNKFLASEITHFFLKNKIAVFSEKPVAINYNSAKKLSILSKKNKTPLVVGYMKRHDNGSKIIKKILNTKKFGNLEEIYYDSLMGNSFPRNYKYIKYKKPFVKVRLRNFVKSSISNIKKKQFVNFLNTHSHGINLIKYYVGDNYKIDLIKKDLKKEVLNFNINNKKITFNYRYNLNGNWKEKVQFYFKKAKVTQVFFAPLLKNKSSKIIIENFNNEYKKIYSNNTWAFKSQANSFISCILNKKKSICKIENCLDDLRIIEKIFI